MVGWGTIYKPCTMRRGTADKFPRVLIAIYLYTSLLTRPPPVEGLKSTSDVSTHLEMAGFDLVQSTKQLQSITLWLRTRAIRTTSSLSAAPASRRHVSPALYCVHGGLFFGAFGVLCMDLVWN